MLILAFDASAGACAAALVRGEAVIASRAEDMDKGHAERLFPMIREMVADLPLSDIDAIAVCTGPGNFTGARIGVAAARGLALALDVPSVGVDRFECAAAGDACIVIPGRGASVHAAICKNGRIEKSATIDRQAVSEFSLGLTISEVSDVDLVALARVAASKIAAGEVERPAPRYLRPVNAALPAEAPPPILP